MSVDPPLPDSRVPAGFVWPADRGRDLLAAVPWGAAQRRLDLVGRRGVDDGSGSSDLVLLEAGGWCLKTSPRRRFVDLDEARPALLQTARRKAALGPLLVPDTVLTVGLEREGGGAWIWTLCPWLDTLRGRMGDAVTRGDGTALASALSDYARAVAESLLLVVRRGLRLDVHPSNFAVHSGRIVYLDDEITLGDTLPAIGHAVLRRAEEYAAFPDAIEVYAAALERELGERLEPSDLARFDFETGRGSAGGAGGVALLRRLNATFRPRRRKR